MSAESELRPVFADFDALQHGLSRELTDDEITAITLALDAQACGRPIAATVEAMETYGGGVSNTTKRILGLLPPQSE